MPTRRPLVPFLLTPAIRNEIRTRDDRWRLSITGVDTGVVTGRMRLGGGNAHTDVWSLFHNREQYEAFAANDPLRFAEPLMLVQAKKEFHHAFDQRHEAAAHGQLDQRDARSFGD